MTMSSSLYKPVVSYAMLSLSELPRTLEFSDRLTDSDLIIR